MKKILTLLLVLVLCVSVFAACKKEEPQPEQPTYDVAAAAEYVEGLYKEELGTTAADFNVVPQVRVAGATYTVTWTVDTDKVTVEVSADGKTVTVNVPEKSKEDFTYVLTATVKAPDGTTATASFTCNVLKYNVNSHADYMAAQKDDELTVEGIVVAMNSVSMGNKYNHLFLADAEVDGGYYCYKLAVDPATLGIQVGMTVSITAKMSPYSGMQELNGGTPIIVDSSIKTVEPLDITDKFLAKEDLAAYVGLPVVIRGVELADQDLSKDTSQYLYFTLGNAKGYVRTYVTDFPAGMLAASDKAAIDADHAAHFGYKADVTGILVLYGTENPYLIPMSVTPFTNYEEQVKTPEEKVAAELAGVKLDASLSSDKVIDLLLAGQYYDDVVLTWTTTDETGAAVIADGKLTLTVPDEAIEVKITVTATCGDVSDSKELTIKLSKSITSIADALVIAGGQEHNTYTTEKHILGGIIVEIQNATYGNMVIKDENGDSILIYGVYINGAKYGEAEGDKPVVGDYVVVIGGLGRYNDTKQMKNGDLMSFVAASSIKDAADAGAAQEHNTYTENKFLVTGVIESIASDKYGNMTIKDADGNSIYVYGVYNQVGTRYDGLTVKPVVGDTVSLVGVAGKYNDTVQLKNATLVAHTAATTEEPPVEETCEHEYVEGVCSKCGETDPDYVPGGSTTPDPEPSVVTTIAGALTAEVGASVEITGMVSEFYQGWNTQYNNCSPYIVDDAGNRIIVFRCKVDVKIGDIISVVGVIGQYNEVNQIAEGSTVTVVTAHVCSTFTEADCLNAAKCTICGKENGTATGHSYVDGVCTGCGATEVSGTVTASKTIASLITELGWTSSTTKQSFTLDDNVSVKIDGGNNTGKAYSGDHIRIYASDSPAGTITISVPDGYELVSIKITTVTGTYAFLQIDGVDSNDISNTVTAVSGSSVVINSVKNGSDGKQSRVLAIEVVYQSVEA